MTDKLFEMNQTKVLHLIELPEALNTKVVEAIEVLCIAKTIPSTPIGQLGNLSINNSA